MQCIKWKISQREMAALWMSDKAQAQAKYYCGKANGEKISTEQETSVHFLNTSFNGVKSSHSGITLPFKHLCRSHTHILTQHKTQTPNLYSNYYYWPVLKQTTWEKLVKIKEKLTQLRGKHFFQYEMVYIKNNQFFLAGNNYRKHVWIVP